MPRRRHGAKRWEYAATYFKLSPDRESHRRHGEELNRLGADGWELCCSSLVGSSLQIFFKRESPPAIDAEGFDFG